ncbi:hypothetical protein V8C26DRAFT_417237 [Trichoderma gracile]
MLLSCILLCLNLSIAAMRVSTVPPRDGPCNLPPLIPRVSGRDIVSNMAHPTTAASRTLQDTGAPENTSMRQRRARTRKATSC